MYRLNRDRILVTGAAGFIGSHLCEKLLGMGYRVTGIDCFREPAWIKEKNAASLIGEPDFTLIRGDILDLELPSILDGINIIFHLAATPGVRSSWGKNFSSYARNNIQSTQALLEAARGRRYLKKFILASTSSVYGAVNGPAKEDMMPRPLSPYGVTKLAGEHLAAIYQREFHLPLTILRYFTVYGPRQRPDMAFHRLIKAALTEVEFTVYGDGCQIRDFTNVADIVEGNIKAMKLAGHGTVYNLGGRSRASLNEIIGMVREITGKETSVRYVPASPGEPRETWADISGAARDLRYSPETQLKTGLADQIEYIRELYEI